MTITIYTYIIIRAFKHIIAYKINNTNTIFLDYMTNI